MWGPALSGVDGCGSVGGGDCCQKPLESLDCLRVEALVKLGEAEVVTRAERKGGGLGRQAELTDGFGVKRFSFIGEADPVVGDGLLGSLKEREDGIQ